MTRRLLALALATGTAVVAAAGGASADGGVAGSSGGGDPYFPAAGNGGYQVEDYDLGIRYEPATRAFDRPRRPVGGRPARPAQLQPRPARLHVRAV